MEASLTPPIPTAYVQKSIFHFDFLVLAREQTNYAAHIRFVEKVFDKNMRGLCPLSSELNNGK